MNLKYIKWIYISASLFGIIIFFCWSQSVLFSILLSLCIYAPLVKFEFLKKKKSTEKKIRIILRLGFSLLSPLILVIFVRTFIFDVFYVPSRSMEKSLFPGDYIFVDKIRFGPNIPENFSNFPVINNLISNDSSRNKYNSLSFTNDYKRNDIIVFRDYTTKKKYLVKRLVGLPGEEIQIINSTVLINNKKLIEPELISRNYLKSNNKLYHFSNHDFNKLPTSFKNKLKIDIKELDNSNSEYYISEFNHIWSRDNFGPLLIPKTGLKIELNAQNIVLYKNTIIEYENSMLFERDNLPKFYTFTKNYYFVLGDNRHNSVDSRTFGFIPRVNIEGKVIFIVKK